MRELLRLAAFADRTPASPSWWGERGSDFFFDRRRARAASRTEWSDIEARRVTDVPGVSTLLSDDLSMDDFDRQMDIAFEVTPISGAERFAGRLRNITFLGPTRALVYASQRVVRGWDARSLWSLDQSLARTLGQQLSALADVAHGWPAGDEFVTAEDWEAALRDNGAKLTRYAHDDDELEDVYADAQEALRWVADHLSMLWD